MSDDIAISVENVSKAYRIWHDPSARLKSPSIDGISRLFPKGSGLRERLSAKAKCYYRDFYALRDISFQVRKGESVGIIGRNGSGKSTLLQIIAGTLQSTAGTVKVNGRVAALLELGSGFNPEFTGRENVYLNAAVLGLTRAETDAKFDTIAAFADIGDFLDQPVKTYSSGMMIRLAFAVAVSVEPEILIVDEALSVGDVFFQQKCFKRVHEMMEHGVSLLFVSHDTAAVQNLCDQAILLVKGDATYSGPPEEAVSRYYAAASGKLGIAATIRPPTSLPNDEAKQLRDKILQYNILPEASSRHGQRGMEILAAAVLTPEGLPSLSASMRQMVKIHLLLKAHQVITSPNAGLHLFDRMNNLVFAAGTRQIGKHLAPLRAGEERIVTLQLTLEIQPGVYTFSLGCSEPSCDGPNQGYIHDRHEGLGPLEVYFQSDDVWPFYGIARLPMEASEWTLE